MSSTLRQTALVCAALGAADRAWLFERLPAALVARIEALIADAHTLGIELSACTLDALIDQLEAQVDTVPPAQARLAAATPEQVVAALAQLPAIWIACVCNSHDWPWRSAVLAALPPATRQAVKQASQRAGERAAALEAALIEALATRLPATHTPAARVSRWRGLRRFFRRGV